MKELQQQTIKITAPGRTCLFGDHQDYLGLPVIACAIDRKIDLIANPNNDKVLRIKMVDIGKQREIPISATFDVLEPRDYFGSAIRVLRREGCRPTMGYDIGISGNIPINSGNSSSSAVLLAWIYFLVEAFGIKHGVTKEYLAELGYRAEILEHNEPGGMMDHFSIAVGGIVKINTSPPFKCWEIASGLQGMVSGVSGVPKETVGLLSRVKGNALQALNKVKANFPDFEVAKADLRDIKSYTDVLPKDLIPYFEAAVENHHITKLALDAFERPQLNIELLGDLMNRHHQVLRDKLKITVPKIDTMIDTVLEHGAYGAKIVGSGGGGSIVVLTEPGTENEIVNALLKAGARDAYPIQVDSGLRRIDQNS